MILIIDGNNVIGKRKTSVSDWRIVRKNFIQEMAKYVAKTGRKVKIVFDGIEDSNYPDGIIFKGVQIFYAKPGKDADERIKSMIRNVSYSRDITVVSSDRDLRSYVMGQGAKVLTREYFRSEFKKLSKTEETENKESNPIVDDIKEWLNFFGLSEKNKEETKPVKE